VVFPRREDTIDVEVAASGFTKEMDEDLVKELQLLKSDDMEAEEESDEEEKESDNDSESDLGKESPITDEDEESTLPVPSMKQIQNGDLAEAIAHMKILPSILLEDIETAKGAGDQDDLRSVSGFSMISRTTTATIPPEVIKDKIRKSFQKGDKAERQKRVRAKGEASATTRSRRANMDNIKQSTGIWGWE